MIKATDKLKLMTKIYIDVRENKFKPAELDEKNAPTTFVFENQRCACWPIKGYPVDVLIYRFEKWPETSYHLVMDLGVQMYVISLVKEKSFCFNNVEGEMELRVFREALLGNAIDEMLDEEDV